MFIDVGVVWGDLHGVPFLSLLGVRNFMLLMRFFVAISVNEQCDPLTGLDFCGKWLARVIRPVFHRPEQGFRRRVVDEDTCAQERR